MPKRIQRKRTKGWRLPHGATCVTRPGKWGNPFETAAKFEAWMERLTDGHPLPALDSPEAKHMKRIADDIEKLRGFDLACWCSLDKPCHADVLLEYANAVKEYENMPDKFTKFSKAFAEIGKNILAAGGNEKWPESQTIDGLELRCTCCSHPEQYDVYDGEQQVAYFRLRHGYFYADVPDCGGETVYCAEPNGDGLFDADERQHYLTEAVQAVRQWQSEVGNTNG